MALRYQAVQPMFQLESEGERVRVVEDVSPAEVEKIM